MWSAATLNYGQRLKTELTSYKNGFSDAHFLFPLTGKPKALTKKNIHRRFRGAEPTNPPTESRFRHPIRRSDPLRPVRSADPVRSEVRSDPRYLDYPVASIDFNKSLEVLPDTGPRILGATGGARGWERGIRAVTRVEVLFWGGSWGARLAYSSPLGFFFGGFGSKKSGFHWFRWVCHVPGNPFLCVQLMSPCWPRKPIPLFDPPQNPPREA